MFRSLILFLKRQSPYLKSLNINFKLKGTHSVLPKKHDGLFEFFHELERLNNLKKLTISSGKCLNFHLIKIPKSLEKLEINSNILGTYRGHYFYDFNQYSLKEIHIGAKSTRIKTLLKDLSPGIPLIRFYSIDNEENAKGISMDFFNTLNQKKVKTIILEGFYLEGCTDKKGPERYGVLTQPETPMTNFDWSLEDNGEKIIFTRKTPNLKD